MESVLGSEAHRALFICLMGLYAICIGALFVMAIVPYHSRTRKLADRIVTPVSAGQGQHGTAAFLDSKRIDQSFPVVSIVIDHSVVKALLQEGDADYRDVLLGNNRSTEQN